VIFLGGRAATPIRAFDSQPLVPVLAGCGHASSCPRCQDPYRV